MTRPHWRRLPAAAILVGAATMGGALVAAPPAPQQYTVVIDEMAFRPAVLHVKRGDRVVWINKDLVPHTATARDRAFDSGRIVAGTAWTLVVRRPGAFAYDCTYHPTMTGTLVVE